MSNYKSIVLKNKFKDRLLLEQKSDSSYEIDDSDMLNFMEVVFNKNNQNIIDELKFIGALRLKVGNNLFGNKIKTIIFNPITQKFIINI